MVQVYLVTTHEFGHQASMSGESTGSALLACLDPTAAALEEASSFAWELAAAGSMEIHSFDSPFAPSFELLEQSVEFLNEPEPSIWAGALHNHGAAILDAALTVTNGDFRESYQLIAFDSTVPSMTADQMQIDRGGKSNIG